jgi:hypothetical protein
LRAQHQGERDGDHSDDRSVHDVFLECVGSSVRGSVVMHEDAGQETFYQKCA